MAQGNAEVDGSKPASRTASSVHDVKSDKPPFGSRSGFYYCASVRELNGITMNRFLTNDADVWSQNAWDHVPPPDDQDEIIEAALAKQRSAPVPENERVKYNEKPAKHW